MSARDQSGRLLRQRQRTAGDRMADPRLRHVVANGPAPAMPADALRAMLDRAAGTPNGSADVDQQPRAIPLGVALAARLPATWFATCERCGADAPVPSSRPVVHPRCKACGPRHTVPADDGPPAPRQPPPRSCRQSGHPSRPARPATQPHPGHPRCPGGAGRSGGSRALPATPNAQQRPLPPAPTTPRTPHVRAADLWPGRRHAVSARGRGGLLGCIGKA